MKTKYRVHLSNGRCLLAVNKCGAIVSMPSYDAPFLDEEEAKEYIRRAGIKNYTLEPKTELE